MRQKYILVSDNVRQNALEAVRQAPKDYVVEIKPKNRTLEQNAKLHALLGEISQKLEWAGAYRDAETWKRLLVAAWLRARGESIEFLPALDGLGVDVVFRHTSQLTVTETIELIEYIYAWATNYNIQLQ